jgi:hypothetical protein
MGTGALVGGAIGGPVGLVAGVGAGLLAGNILAKGQDWLLDKLGWRDKAQELADQEQHPTAKMLGEMAPAVATLHPSGSMLQRGIGAAIGGGVSAATDYLQNGEINPESVIAGAGLGAAFPSFNRLGRKFESAGARIGAAARGNTSQAPVTAPEAPAEPVNRDLKMGEGYTDEGPPDETIPAAAPAAEDVVTNEPPPGSVAATDPQKATEWGLAKAALAKMDLRDPLRASTQTYLDDLGKVDREPSGQATPSTIVRTSRGTSESFPAPAERPDTTGNTVGAPMVAREAARPSDPTRDYRSDKPEEPADTTGLKPSVKMETSEGAHSDILAAMPQESGEVSKPPGDANAMPQREQPPAPEPPVAPIETGLAPQLQQPVVQPAEPVAPEVPENVAAARAKLEKLDKATYPDVLKIFDRLAPDEQARYADKVLAATKSLANERDERAIQHDDKSYKYNSLPEKNRIDESIKAVKQAVSEIPKDQELSIVRDKEGLNKKEIIAHAKDVVNRTNQLYAEAAKGYKDGEIDKGGLYTPNELVNRLPEHAVLKAAKKAAAKKATWADLENYVKTLKDPTVRPNVEADVELRKTPSVEDISETTPGNTDRPEFQHLVDEKGGNANVEAYNELVDYVNDMTPSEYEIADGVRDGELATEINTYPRDSRKYLEALQHNMKEANLFRKQKSQGGTTTPIKDAEGLAKFEKRNKLIELSKKFMATTKEAAKDTSGSIALPKWPKWAQRDPTSPADPERTPEVKQQLDSMTKDVRAYANARAKIKLWLRGMENGARAYGFTPEQWKDIHLAITEGTEKNLPGKQYDAVKEHVMPMIAKRDLLYRYIYEANKYGLGLDLADPDLVSEYRNIPRMATDEEAAVPGENNNVVTGNKLNITAPSIKNREFMRLVNQDTGDSIVLHRSLKDGKFSIYQNGKIQPLTKLPADFEGNVGDTMSLFKGGKKTSFKVDEASDQQIEAATAGQVKFVHNPIITLANSINQLHNIKSNIDFIQGLKNDPWWKENTVTKSEAENDPTKQKLLEMYDKIPTQLDAVAQRNGQDIYMPKGMRWLLDDMHKQGFGNDDLKWLSNAGSLMSRSFLVTGSPIHDLNMITNGIIARGYRNVTPQGLNHLATYGGRAIKALMDPANSPDYKKAMEAGVDFQFHNTMTNDLIPGMMKRFGMDVAQKPSKWDPVTKALGFNVPEIAKAIEHLSTSEMWRIGDMIPLQRFMELTEGHGMEPKAAAAEVNKFTSYYTDPTFLTDGKVGRFLQQAMVDPRTSLFGRWHMLLMRSMGHIFRDAIGPDRTPQQRAMAGSQMLTAGALAYAVYPAIDAGVRALTGNDKAEMGRRGMLAPEDAVRKVLQGDADYAKIVGTLWTPAIPMNMALQGLRNQQWNGKPIVPPADYTKPRNTARAAGDVGDWAARSAVPPYGTIADNLTKTGSLAGTAGKFAAGMVGVRIPSAASRKYEAQETKHNNQTMKQADRHPAGPLSWLASHFGR